MRLTLFIGLCFLADLIGAQTWGKSLNVPPLGQKLGPLNSELPVVRFECAGRGGGYYGDMDFGCSIFHYCTADGTRYTFKCTKGLKFNEMTTSCSAGFFGDCSHPEILGSAGRNMTAEPAPVKSFQNIPVFKGEDKSYDDDPRDYPEPFIQHYDPALDLNYDYYEEEDANQGSHDAQPSASNILPDSNFVNSKANWNTGMESALSAFASLVNVPLDTSSNAKARIDRMDTEDPAEYANNIDRTFIAQPPLHESINERENLRQPYKFSSYKNGPKKTVGIGSFTGYSRNLIPVSPPPLYPVAPTENYPGNQDQISNGPSSKQFQNIIPYNLKDSYVPQDESIHQTTPDTFRPSSLMTDNPEDFQPVPNSDNEQSEHKRPYRQATHQSDHGGFPSNFQSFSQTPGPFAPTRFPPGHAPFGGPSSSQRGFETSGGFLPAPNFPSSGNFVFNQPPIHPAVFNAPFRSVSPQSGPGFSRPRPLTHTTSTFSNSPPEHHAHFIHHPGPPPPPPPRGHNFGHPEGHNFGHPEGHNFRHPEGHNFGPPPDELVLFRPQSQQNDKTFIHSNSFINTPSHKPPSPPAVRNFIHHTTPSSVHTFATSPVQNTFSSDFQTRPTPTPGFLPTPSPSPFNNDQQNPFNFQHERPLLESFPNIARPLESQTTDLPLFSNKPVHHDFVFPISTTTRPSLSTVSEPISTNQEETDAHGTLSEERPNLPPALDPRPNRRRRPVASRKPVPFANQQPVQFTTFRPVPFTTQQPISFSKRPPSRTIRKNIANRFNDGTPTLVTGLEHSEFHSQFLQPDGRHPGIPQTQTEVTDTYTEFDDSQLREPDSLQPEDSVSNNDSGKHFSDSLLITNTENVDASDILYETEDESNNIVEYGSDYDVVTDTPTTSPAPPSTTTQTVPVTFRGPLLRRRPNLRNRVRTRLPSRGQTTPQPSQSDENIVVNDENDSSNDPETTDASDITTISPFRQRVQDRLNRFKEHQSTETSSTTTESPEEDNIENSESNSESEPEAPRKPTGPRNTNSERFQNYRDRLRNRLRNRTPRTTVAPDSPRSNNNQAASRPSSLLTNQRNRRINPLKSRRQETVETTDVDNESTHENVAEEPVNVEMKENKDSADEVPDTEKETPLDKEPNTDQQVQETSQSLIQKPPPSADLSINEANGSDVSKNEDDSLVVKNEEEMPKDIQETDPDSANVGVNASDNLKESSENPENDKESTDPKRRRIINPNFRARFREFIKNRKSRVDASDSITAPDTTGDETEDKPDVNETPEVTQDENSSLSFKERMEHFNKNRENVRKRFLANRQTSDGDRAGRRIPQRPFRNKFVAENEKSRENLQIADQEISVSTVSPEVPEQLESVSEGNDNSQSQNAKRNSVIVNKVTDGFTPALSPIHVKSPLIEHLSLQGTTTPVQETEIITAAPSAKVGDPIATFKVSATLTGENEGESLIDNSKQTVEKESGLNSEETNSEQKSALASPTLEHLQEKSGEIKEDPTNMGDGTKSLLEQRENVPVPEFSSSPDAQNLHTESEKEENLPGNNNHMQSENVEADQSPPESRENTHISLPNTELQSPKDNDNSPESRENAHVSLENTELQSPKDNDNSPDITGSDALPRGETIDTNADITEKQSDSENSPQVNGEEESGLSGPPLNDNEQTPTLNLDEKQEEIHNPDTVHKTIPDTPKPKVTKESESTRVSKPTFDISGAGNKNANSESSAISASDFSEEISNSATPVSLLPITMSTDPPKLPLEMLLPLFRRR
ncbi:mucin-2-like [Palaemon carinicauda]|uniref:mucin-2-like n=1 Tax=Palaemon carinicauda TaxID=392227 RepID=UPI0035B678F2